MQLLLLLLCESCRWYNL